MPNQENEHLLILKDLIASSESVDAQQADKFFFFQQQKNRLNEHLHPSRGFEDKFSDYRLDAHKLIESAGEVVTYCPGYFVSGTAMPHELIESGIQLSTIASASAPSDWDATTPYYQAIELMQRLYQQNKALFSERLLKFRPHLQSLLRADRPYPIMGINAIVVALSSYFHMVDGFDGVGNIWQVADSLDDEFSLDLVFHADVSQMTHQQYINNYYIFYNQELYYTDDMDYSELGGIFLLTKLQPFTPNIPPYPSTIQSLPLKDFGFEQIPTNWLSAIFNYYQKYGNYAQFIETCSQYNDVFALLLACSSGLDLMYFRQLIAKDSGFFDLDSKEQISILVKMKNLADPIAMMMQQDGVKYAYAFVD